MIISELYLAWSLLLLFQTWLEAHVLESCCSSLPWQIGWWSLPKTFPLPTLSHGALLGVAGPRTTHPSVELGQLWHCCCVPGILVPQKQPKKIQHLPFSAYSWAQANVSCHVCALSLPKCISHAVHIALLHRQRACPVGVCLYVFPYPCP